VTWASIAYRELQSGNTETFVLESLLPGTGYDVHISKMRVRGNERRVTKPVRAFCRRSCGDFGPCICVLGASGVERMEHGTRLPHVFLLRFRNAGRGNQCEGKKENRRCDVGKDGRGAIFSHELDGDECQRGVTDPG